MEALGIRSDTFRGNQITYHQISTDIFTIGIIPTKCKALQNIFALDSPPYVQDS
jgi:hypothetical protein